MHPLAIIIAFEQAISLAIYVILLTALYYSITGGYPT